MYRFIINKRYVNLLKAIARTGKHDILEISRETGITYSRMSNLIMQFAREGLVVKNRSIDSSWMHVAGCFKKPMLTFWGGTHKDNFGYNHEGSFHAFTKNAMHGRPYFAVHDRSALYPYKDKREGFEFDFSMRDIEKHINKFADSIKNKEGGKNVESDKGNLKKDVL